MLQEEEGVAHIHVSPCRLAIESKYLTLGLISADLSGKVVTRERGAFSFTGWCARELSKTPK